MEPTAEALEKFYPYNVRDELQPLTVEEIRTAQGKVQVPLEFAMFQEVRDFNFAGMVRNAVAFGVRRIHLIGDKKWDRRGAVGAHNYVEIVYHESFDRFCDWLQYHLEDYRFMAVENNVAFSGSYQMTLDEVHAAIHEYGSNLNLMRYMRDLRSRSVPIVALFGEESRSLSPRELSACDSLVTIEMPGVMRSLNVAAASALIAQTFFQLYTKG